MKYKRKLAPACGFDLPAMESWLEDGAAEGLFLESFSNSLVFARFRKGEPKKLTYRIDLKEYFDTLPPPKMREMYEEFGWEFVTHYRNKGYIFCTAQENPTELHTDPVAQSAGIRSIYESARKLYLAMLIISLLLMAAFAVKIWRDLASWIILPFSRFFGLPELMMLVALTASLMELRFMKKEKERLELGIPMEHRKDYRPYLKKQKFWLCYAILLPLGLFVVGSAGLFQSTIQEKPPVAAVASDIPYLPLDGLADADNITHSSVHYEETLLAPQYFNIYEQSKKAWLQVEYLEVRPDFLVEQAYLTFGANGQLQRSAFIPSGYMADKTTLIPAETCDDIRYFRNETRQMLMLRKGNHLLKVRYGGPAALEDYAVQFAALLQKEYDAPVCK